MTGQVHLELYIAQTGACWNTLPQSRERRGTGKQKKKERTPVRMGSTELALAEYRLPAARINNEGRAKSRDAQVRAKTRKSPGTVEVGSVPLVERQATMARSTMVRGGGSAAKNAILGL